MIIQESGEMYLETILVLRNKLEHVRSIDICNYMDYSKPSISKAMSHLKAGGYVTMDSNNYIELTEAGEEIAKKIYERHIVLTAMLEDIGVDNKTATEDACRIEHDISDETFAAIKKHLSEKHNFNFINDVK